MLLTHLVVMMCVCVCVCVCVCTQSQGAALLHRLSRSVLHALLSAPSSIGNVDAFDALLNEHEQDETGVIINSHYTTNTASAGAAQCKCHDWQVERGLMTVMWSDSPGLEVRPHTHTDTHTHTHTHRGRER